MKRQKSRARRWKKECIELRSGQPKVEQVAGHPYTLDLIWLGLLMVIKFNVSLRAASKSLCKMGSLLGCKISYISPTTLRNWCLKLGLYYLSLDIKGGNYVLILDESVEIGREHLMLLIGLRVDNSSPIKELTMEDMVVFGVKSRESWRGEKVHVEIEKILSNKNITLDYAVADKGSSLRKGLGMSGLTWVSDCTHEMANSTKELYSKDDKFSEFIKRMNALRAKWVMSKNNKYLPPGLRKKSRFHQVFMVWKWAEKCLDQWSNLSDEAKQELEFLQTNRALIAEMKQIHGLIVIFSGIFKSVGIQATSKKEWADGLAKFRQDNPNLSTRAGQFIQYMNDYISRQEAKFDGAAQILCCSDIIESMFGKYKNKGGVKMITEDILQIAAYAQPITREDVRNAMTGVQIKDILDWKAKNTTISKLVRKILPSSKKAA